MYLNEQGASEVEDEARRTTTEDRSERGGGVIYIARCAAVQTILYRATLVPTVDRKFMI